MTQRIYKYSFAELFCGPGGLSKGVLEAVCETRDISYRVTHAWATDNDPDSCETYRSNISPNLPKSVICADIRNLNIADLPPAQSIAFGFPCNDFSVVGEQKGVNGHYGGLYRYGIKTLESHNPLWFIAENVGGLRSANEGMAFRTILAELEVAGYGYALTTHLYKFEDYGVPQTRHRIFIVGIRSDLGLKFRVPAPTTPEYQATAYDALMNPPIPEGISNHEFTRQSPRVIERLEHIPPGSNAWDKRVPTHLRLNVDKVKISLIYRRLDPYKPSYTITGSGGGGTHVYHWSEPRALTNRERARIQTFPDDFVFSGSKESVRKQIGMAVPPHVAKIVAVAILKTLAGESYISVPENLSKYSRQSSLFSEESDHDRALHI